MIALPRHANFLPLRSPYLDSCQRPASVDISFSDTLDKLDLAYMFLAEAGYGRWTLSADLVYGDFSGNTVAPLGFSRIDYEFTQWVLTATVGYRVIQTEGSDILRWREL